MNISPFTQAHEKCVDENKRTLIWAPIQLMLFAHLNLYKLTLPGFIG